MKKIIYSMYTIANTYLQILHSRVSKQTMFSFSLFNNYKFMKNTYNTTSATSAWKGKMSLLVITLLFAGMANAANWFWIGGNGSSGTPSSFTNNANWATTYGGATTGTPNYTGAVDNFIFDGGNIGGGVTNNTGSGGTPLYVAFSSNVSINKFYFTGNIYVYFSVNGNGVGTAGGSIICSALDLGTANGIGSGSNVAGCYFNDGGNTILVTGLGAGANAITGSSSGIHTSAAAVSTTATGVVNQYGSIQNVANTSGSNILTVQTGLSFPSGTFLLTNNGSGTGVAAGATFTASNYTSASGQIQMSAVSTAAIAASGTNGGALAWYVYTTASASINATTLTVPSGLTIPIGTQIYPGTGIAAGTTVTGYSGTTLTLSTAITAGISANQGLVPLALTGTYTVPSGLSIAVGDLVTGGAPGTTNVSSNVYVKSYSGTTLVLASTNGTYNATVNSTVMSSAAINISGEIKLAAAAAQTIPSGLTFGNLDLSASATYTYTLAGNMNVGNLYFTKNSQTANTNITLADGGNTITVSGGIFCGIGTATTGSGTGQYVLTGTSPYLGNGSYNGTITVNKMNLKTGNTSTSFYCNVVATTNFSFDAANPNGNLILYNNPSLTIGTGGAATYTAATTNLIKASASNSGGITINSTNNTVGSPVGTFNFDATNYKFAGLIVTNGYATFNTISSFNSSSTLTAGTLVTAAGANISFLSNVLSLNGGTLKLGTNSTVSIAAAIAGTGGSGTGIDASATGAGVTFYGPAAAAGSAIALPRYFFANTSVSNLTDSLTSSNGSTVTFNSAAAAITVTNLKLANTNTGTLIFNVYSPVSITIPANGSFTIQKGNTGIFNYTTPTFSGAINIGYLGTTAITTGSELANATTLQNLTVNNSGGVSIANGTVVNSLSVTAGGSYTVAPTGVTFTGGSPSTAATATAYLNLGAASFGSVTGGSGYTNGSAVTFTGGGGVGAAGTINVTSGAITGITITNPGVGYTSLPTLSFTGGTGATLAFSSAPLLVYLTGYGVGYSSTPTVGFTGGAGSGASVTASRLTTSTTVNGTLYLTLGALTNTSSNLTIAASSTISRAAGTVAAAPIFGSSSSSRVNVTITATCTSANELLGTTGKIGTLTVNGVNASGVITPATYTLGAPTAIDGLTVTNSGDIFNASTFVLSGNTSNTIASLGLGTVQTQCVTGTSSTPLPQTSGGWAGTVNYNANTTNYVQTVVGGTYTNLNFGGTGATTIVTASGNINVNGTLTSTYSGNTLDMSTYVLGGTPTSISIVGTLKTAVPTTTSTTPLPAGLNWGATGTVYYYGATAQSLPSGTFNNLSIYIGGTAVSMTGSVTVGNLLYFSTGTSSLIVGPNTLTLKSSVTATGSGGNINATNGSATVVYNGNALQTIAANTFTGSGSINNLTINNSSTGPSAGVVLNQNLTVAGILTLTQGRVNTSTNSLTISNTAAGAITGAGLGTTSYINGAVIRGLASGTNSGSYLFPVGIYSSADYYYGFTLTNPVASASATVSIQATVPGGTFTAGANLSSVSANEYWNMSVTGGTVAASSVLLSSAAAAGAGNNAVTYGTSNVTNTTFNSIGASVAYPILTSGSPLPAGSTYYFAMGIATCTYCVTSVLPNSAFPTQSAVSANGYYGQQVTIGGNGLDAITSLTVNGSASIPAVSFVSQNSSQIVVVVPADAGLNGNIVATNGSTPLSFSFTVNGYITQGGATDWNTAASWLGGVVPATSGAGVVVNNSLTINGTAALAVSSLNITTGNTLSFGSGSTSLTIAAGGTITNNGTFTQSGSGTLVFAGAGSITGTTPSFYNLTVGGSLTFSSSPTINNNLTISCSSPSFSPAPIYASSATLIYNASTTAGSEWGVGNTVGSVYVTTNGNGLSNPAVVFTGGSGTGAAATANVNVVGLLSLSNAGGAGYTYNPTVTISGGGGSGATATALINTTTGVVSALTILNPGSGYTSAPTVTISAPSQPTWLPNVAYALNAIVKNGANAYICTVAGTSAASGGPSCGSGTCTDNTVTWSYITPTTATATATLGVGSINITNAGSGYTSMPTVTIGGFVASATYTAGQVGQQIVAGGYLYTISAGTTGATAPTWTASNVTSGSVTFTYVSAAGTAAASVGSSFGALGLGVPQNITINNGFAVTTPSGARTVLGTLTIGTSTSTTTLTAAGSITFANNATLAIATSSTLTMGSNAMYVGTGFTNSGLGIIITQSTLPARQTWSGTVKFNYSSGYQQINPGTFNNIDLDAGTGVSRNLDIGSGYGGGTFLINGTMTWSGTGSIATNQTTFNFAPGSSFVTTAGSSSIIFYNLGFNSTTPPTITGGSGNWAVANVFTPQVGTTLTSSTPIVFTTATGGGVYIGSQTIPAINYYNLTITGSRTINNVVLANSGTIGVAGTLTYSPTFTLGSLVNTGSSVTYNGTGAQTITAISYNNLTIAGTRTSTPTITLPSGTINVAGTFTTSQSGNVNYTTTSNTLNLNGSGTSSISSPFTYQILNLTAGTLNINIATTGNGLTTVSNGATLSVAAAHTNTGGLTENGALQINGGSLSVTPTYTGTASLTYTGTSTIGNEWTSGTTVGSGVPPSVTINAGTITTPASLRTVVGNLTINGGTLSLGNGGLQVYGNWSNAGTFAPNGNSITFGGTTSNVTITNTNSGTETFAGLTINNINGVSLASNVNLTNLTLNSGVLTSTGYILKVNNNSTSAISGGSATSYVDGPLSWAFNTSSGSYIFPTGNYGSGQNNYYPFTLISPNTGGLTKTITVQAFNSGSGAVGSLGSLQSIGSEYWSLNTSATLSSIGNVALSSSNSGDVTSSSVVARSTGTTYTNENIASAGGGGSGTVTSSDAIGTNNTQYYAVGTPIGFTLGSIVPTSLGFAQNNTSGYFGQTITINGNGFTGSTTVSIGGVDISSSITNQTSTALTLTLPTGISTGSLLIQDGSNSASATFTVYGYVSIANSDWNTGSTWLNGSVPPSNSVVIINNSVTVNSAVSAAPNSITINTSKSLIFGASGSLTANTALTNNLGGTLTMTAGGTLYIGGTISNSGTFNAGTGTINFSGTSQSIPVLSYNNLTISNSTATPAGNLSIGGTLTIASGAILDLNTTNISSVSATSGTGTLQIETAGSSIPSSVSWAFPVTYDGTGAQTIASGSYSTLTISGAHGSSSVTFSGTINISGNLVYTPTYSTGNAILTSNTINLNGNTPQTINASGITFNTLINSNSTATVSAVAPFGVTTLNLTTGSILDMSTNVLSVGIGSVLTTSGNGTLKTANTTSGTPIPASKTWNCLVEFSAIGGGQTIPSSATPSTFNGGITCDNTSGVDSVIGGNIYIGGKLTMVSNTGIFAMGGTNLLYSGGTTFDGTSFAGIFRTSVGGGTGNQFPAGTSWGTGSTVVYTAAASSNTRLTPATYYNLNTDNGYSQALNCDYAVNSTGIFTVNGTLTTTNSMTTPRFSTWVFNGSSTQNIPAWNFYNLTLNSHSVLPSGTVTVSGIFNPNGLTSASQGTIAFNPVPSFSDLNVNITGFTFNNLTFGGAVSSISNKTGSTYNGSVAVAMNNAADVTNLATNLGITGTNIPTNNTITGTSATVTTSYLSTPYYIVYSGVYYLSYPNNTNSQTDFSNTTTNQALMTGTGGSTSHVGLYVKSHFGAQSGSSTFYAQFTNSSATVTFTKNSNNSALNAGMIVTTTNANVSIPAGAYIQSVGSATSIGGGNYTFAVTLSAAPTVTSGPVTDQNVLVGSVNIISGALSGFSSGSQYNNTSNPNFTYSPGIVMSTAATGTSSSASISTYNVNLTFGTGVNVNGLLTDSHTGVYNTVTNNGPVILKNGSSFNLNSNFVYPFPGNLTVDNSATVTAANHLDLAGTLTVPSTATLNMGVYWIVAGSVSGNSFATNISGTLNIGTTTSTPLPKGYTWGGTVNYNSASGQTVAGGTYTNLNLTGGGSRNLSGISSSLDTIFIQGNYTAGSSTTISTSAVVFNGGALQTISSAATNTANFYYLTVRKSGTVNALTLNTPVRVGTANKGALRIQNARIVTSNTNPLIMCDSVISTSGQADSVIVIGNAYIDGPFSRYVKAGSSGYLYPVGSYSSGDYYLPDTLTSIGTTDSIQISAVKNTGTMTPDGTSLTSVDNTQYWLVRSQLATNNVAISFVPNSLGSSNTVAELRSGTFSAAGGTTYSSSINSSGIVLTSGNDSTFGVGVVNIQDPAISSFASSIVGGTTLYPNDTLTIIGTNLSNPYVATTVTIGGKTATINSNDGTTLKVTIPASGTSNSIVVNTGATPKTVSGIYDVNGIFSIADADWNTASTWSTSAVPSGTKDVFVKNNVTINSNNGGANNLTVGSSGLLRLGVTGTGTISTTATFTNNGTVNIGSYNGTSGFTGILTVNGNFLNNASGNINVGATSSGYSQLFTKGTTNSNAGTITIANVAYSTGWQNYGALSNTGSISCASTFELFGASSSFTGNAINWDATAGYLCYNNGKSNTPNSEWIPNSSSNVPHNVQIGSHNIGGTDMSNTSVVLTNNNWTVPGYLRISATSSETISNGKMLTVGTLQDSGTLNIGTSTLGATAIFGTSATLNITSGTSNIGTQGTLNLYGYMKVNGAFAQLSNNGNTGTMNVYGYAVYEGAHANAFIPTVTSWPSTSTLYITGFLGGPHSGNSNQNFGNVVFNNYNQVGTIGETGFNNASNMVILNTGALNSGLVLRFSNTTNTWGNLQVGGSYSLNADSTINPVHSEAAIAYNINNSTTSVAGNVSIGTGDTLLTTFSTGTKLNIGGNLTVNGGFTNTSTNVAFIGTTTSIIATSNASMDFDSLTINKTGTAANAKVTLNSPATVAAVGILTLTAGRIVTTSNPLTIYNSASTAVTGGGNSPFAYIDGPLVWTLPSSNSSGTYIYPIGTYSSATDYYYPLTLNSPTTGAGTVTVTAQAVKAAAGGAGDGTSLQSSLSGRQYWSLTSSGNYNGASISLGATASDISGSGYAYNAIGFSTTQNGTYASYAGTATSSAVNSSSTVSGNGYLALGSVYISPSPTISSVSADVPAGLNAGYPGTTLTINGTNLRTVSAVTIGGVAASSFTVISNTQISAVVASSGVSSGSITVTNSNPISPTATKTGFVYYPGIVSKQSGDWNTASTWLTGVIPSSSSIVTVANIGVSLNTVATVANLTINSGASLNISTTSNSGVLNVTSSFINNGTFNDGATNNFSSGTSTISGTFSNTGTVNIGSSTANYYGWLLLSGGGTNSGTINVNYFGTSSLLMLGSSLSNTGTINVNNSLQLNGGGTITGNGSVIYGINSTLFYNTGTTTNPGSEWLVNPVASILGTSGVPHNVTIGDKLTGTSVANTVVSFGTDNRYRALAGNLVISTTSTGAGLQLSSVAGGDLKIGGSFTATQANASAYNSLPGGFDANGRQVHFIAASGAQTITGPSASAIAFHYITIGASTSSTNSISLGSDIAITAPNGGAPFTLTAPITGNGIFYLNANSGTAHNVTIGTIGQTITGTVYIRGGGLNPSNLTINGNTNSTLNLNIDYGGGNSFLNNFTVNNVNVVLQSVFSVRGNLVNNGTISGTPTLTLGGSIAQTIDGTGSINNLTINNTLGVTINSGMQSVTGVLTVNAGNFNTGNNLLTLKSTSIVNSAVLAPLVGTISGTATVERFVPKGFRSYRDLSAGGVYSATNYLFNTWQESGSYTNTGYGMFITGILDTNVRHNSVDVTTGLDHSLSGSPSAFYYRAGWDTIRNTRTEFLNPYQSYRVLVRGDRSFDLDTTPVISIAGPLVLAMNGSTTLRASGSLITGNVTFSKTGVTNGVYSNNIGLNSASNSYTYIANPYPCPIDFKHIYTNNGLVNVHPYYYYLDPTIGSTGAWVVYNAASNASSKWGLNNNGQYIQTGQGFLVRDTSSGDPQLIITEADKSILSSARTSVFGAEAQNNGLGISLMKQSGKGFMKMDGAVAVFGSQFSNGIGIEDAGKMSNASDNLSIIEAGKNLSIDGRLPAKVSDKLPISLGQLSGTNYQLVIDASVFTGNGVTPYLQDTYLNKATALSNGIDTFSFTADAKVAATYQGRFSVVFKPTTLSVNSIVATATANGNVATIKWNTVGENGVAKFEVEKSIDGSGFTKIGEMAAKNTATASYSATDKDEFTTTYYRIKAISFDGVVTYSNITKLITNNELGITLYPNPLVGRKLSFDFNNLVTGKFVVSITNALGQKVAESTIAHTGGNGTHAINIEHSIAAGVYNVVIRDLNSKEQVFQTSLSIQY